MVISRELLKFRISEYHFRHRTTSAVQNRSKKTWVGIFFPPSFELGSCGVSTWTYQLHYAVGHKDNQFHVYFDWYCQIILGIVGVNPSW
jgi:hypothetical protein